MPPQPRLRAAEEALQVAARPRGARGQSGGVFSTDSVWLADLGQPRLPARRCAHRDAAGDHAGEQEGRHQHRQEQQRLGARQACSLGKTLKTDIGIDAQRDFDGSASSTQQNTLQGAITVVVQEVLPNGLLRIRGEKSLTLNQGEEFIRVSGYVRDRRHRHRQPRVVAAHRQCAHRLFGRAAPWPTPSAGWLTRFFNSPWMPF